MAAFIGIFTLMLTACGFKSFNELELEGKSVPEQTELIVENMNSRGASQEDVQQYMKDFSDWYKKLSDEEKAEVKKYSETLEGDSKEALSGMILMAQLGL